MLEDFSTALANLLILVAAGWKAPEAGGEEDGESGYYSKKRGSQSKRIRCASLYTLKIEKETRTRKVGQLAGKG